MSAAELSAMASLAIGLALSPMAIIELLLVLLSKRRVINSVAFVISLWVMMAIAVVLGALGSRAAAASASSDGSSTRWVLAIFAVVMIGLAIMNWIKRRDTSEPKVFRAIGDMRPIAVALLTPGLTLINPKNLPLLLGGGKLPPPPARRLSRAPCSYCWRAHRSGWPWGSRCSVGPRLRPCLSAAACGSSNATEL